MNKYTQQYIDLGFELIPLAENSKRWDKDFKREDGFSNGQIVAHKGNFAFIIGKDHVFLDVDDMKELEELFNDHNMPKFNFEPSVITKRGCHYYFKIPEGYEHNGFNKRLAGVYDKLEIFHGNMHLTCCGSVIEEHEYKSNTKMHIYEAPVWLLDIYKKEKKKKPVVVEEQVNINTNEVRQEKGGKVDVATLKDLLERISPDINRDDWVKVGMAIYNDYNDGDAGLSVWKKWSLSSGTHDSPSNIKMIESQWKSFHNDDNGITCGTLRFLAGDGNKTTYPEYKTKILGSDSEEDLEKIIYSVQSSNITGIQRELLVPIVKDKYKEICGTVVSVKNIKSLLLETRKTQIVLDDDDFIADERPDFVDSWVWNNTSKLYINKSTGKTADKDTFNKIHSVDLPSNEFGKKTRMADEYCTKNGFIEVVDDSIYLPYTREQKGQVDIVYKDDKKYINTFDIESVPARSSSITEEGKIGISVVENHFRNLFGTDENSTGLTNAETMMCWTAHQVQKMGELVGWAPLIQSTIEGVGKGIFKRLLVNILGRKNVGEPSNSIINEKYTAWFKGKALFVAEEIKVDRNSSERVLNTFKPLITEEWIESAVKHGEPVFSYNTSNLMGFTNYKDALALASTDRRWMVIYSEFGKNGKYKNYKGASVSKNEYFDELVKVVDDHRAELRTFFLDYEIDERFNKCWEAPITLSKKELIDNVEEDSLTGKDFAEHIIKKHKFFDYIGKDFIVGLPFFKYIESLDTYIDFKRLGTSAKNKILTDLGYVKYGKDLHWIDSNLQACRVYVKKNKENLCEEEMKRQLMTASDRLKTNAPEDLNKFNTFIKKDDQVKLSEEDFNDII